MTRKRLLIRLSLLAYFLTTPVLAKIDLHPVLTVGSGVALSSSVGQSQNFAAQIPTNFLIFNYSSRNANQSSALFNSFLGVEWGFTHCWHLQTGLTYNQTSPYLAKGTFAQGVDAGSADTYSYQYHIVAKQLLVEGKLLYLFQKIFRPYVTAGVGAAFNRASNYGTNVPPFLTFTRMYSNNNSTTFSYSVGVGMDIDITTAVRLGLGYRFSDFGQTQLGSAIINTTPLSGTLSQSHFYTNEIVSQLSFVF